MLKPLKQWVCDVCGEVIEKPEDGYVVWNDDDEFRYFDFTVIHQGRCDNDRLPNSLPVTEFLGEQGITVLMSKLSLGPVINRNRDCSCAGRVPIAHGGNATTLGPTLVALDVAFYQVQVRHQVFAHRCSFRLQQGGNHLEYDLVSLGA